MDLALLAGMFGFLTFVVIFGTAYAMFGKGRVLEERVTHSLVKESKPRFNLSRFWKRSQQVFKPLGEMIPRSPQEMSRQERRLMIAGIRHKDGPAIFYGVKLGLFIILLVTFALTGHLQKRPVQIVPISLLLSVALPDIWLKRRGRKRQENIQLAIPDVLDLAVVCVEAGLGLDQSLMRIGQEVRTVHPEISEELRLYNLEVNVGRSRAEALRNLANRTDVDDLKSLVAVLIQTDRFGTGIAQSLRVFSDSLRTKRRQRAEERAAKTTVKLVPVLVFFIFPAIFIVIVFPAFIALVRELLPGMSK
ncbi:MAG TPA: type II secretion system F family protein [Blastocatellia bacterium]|nr:type II secretion system F family protein [Blastocatellia bacterium]